MLVPHLKGKMMKKISVVLMFTCVLLAAASAHAQGIVQPAFNVHYVKVTYKAPPDANGTTAYKIFADTKACPADGSAPTTAILATSTPTTSLVWYDLEPVGPYCYYVTAVTNGLESGPSNTSTAVIRPFAPTVTTAPN